jgi:hypothetical protein
MLLLVGANLGSSGSILYMVANTLSFISPEGSQFATTLLKFRSHPMHWQVRYLVVLTLSAGKRRRFSSHDMQPFVQ